MTLDRRNAQAAPGRRPVRRVPSAARCRPARLLAGLVAAAVVTAAGAQDATPPPAEPPAPAASDAPGGAQIGQILQWLHDGNGHALADLYTQSKDPVVHVWTAMAIERLHFNLDVATRDAELCLQSLIDSQPAVALLCGEFAAGDERLAGHWQAARDRELALVKRFEGHHVDARLAALQRLLDAENTIAQPQISAPAGAMQFELVSGEEHPMLEAQAGREKFNLAIDTGATDLVIGQDLAERLHVRALDQHARTSGWLTKDVTVQRGVLDSLRIGAVEWRNVPVRILPHRNAWLGGNLLAPLGTLRLTRKTLDVLADTPPNCSEPMEAGSDLHGRSFRLLPALQVNDTLQTVLLDTGTTHFLLGTKAALEQVTRLERKTISMGDVGGRHPFTDAETAKIGMTISGQPFKIYFTVLTESDAKHAIAVGSGALKDMDFVMDFRHQHLCFALHPGLH